MASATFTVEQQIASLEQALATGAITQQQYTIQYNLIMGITEVFSWEKFFDGLLGTLNPINWERTL